MNHGQKQTLLSVACDTLESVVCDGDMVKTKSDDPELNAHCGCFVTLKNKGRLRGCIGHFISEISLIELVAKMAEASARSDPRFFDEPILAGELERLDIEISVLSPLQRADEPLSLRLGIDGIYIKRAGASGCLLPQVATETGGSKQQFLSYCCEHKAGLSPDAWKQRQTKVYLFTADVFGSTVKDIRAD